MKLSDNFSLSEFRCNDGTDVPDEYMDNVRKLAENLQILRVLFQLCQEVYLK